MINKMRFVSLTVTDLGQARDFYVNKLGFQVVVEMPMPGGNQFVMVAPPGGGSNLVYSLPMGRPHAPTVSISFETDDMQATYAELMSRGVEFAQVPTPTRWGGTEARFSDPFGNSFLLQQGWPGR